MERRRLSPPLVFVLFALALAPALQAVTYVAMTDSNLVDSSPVIVRGTVLSSIAQPADSSTLTRLAVDETLKGSVPSPLVVRVPGFATESEALLVPGAPRFSPGERVLLFLAPRRDGTWGVEQFLLGAFHEVDRAGERLALRDLEGAVELGGAAAESARRAPRFAAWVRDRSSGHARTADYLTAATTGPRSTTADYTLLGNARWQVFDGGGGVAWEFHSAGWDGSGAGASAFSTARAAWNADSATPVQYSSAGSTSSIGPGLGGTDGHNRILFGDPNNEIAGSFACSSGGVLAIGGYNTSGSHVYHGSSFGTISEGDIVVQDGIGCFFNAHPGAEEEVFAHELGHTLGLGHSADSAALMFPSAGPPYGATLGSDDLNGLCFLYGASCAGGPPPSAPAAPNQLSAIATSPTTAQLGWSDNSSNETSFRIEVRTGAQPFAEIGSVGANSTGANLSGLSPETPYDFRVRARNGTGDSAYSNIASATTPTGGSLPTAPSSLQAAALSPTSIRLTWQDNSTNESEFRLERLVGGSFVDSGGVLANTTAVDVIGLLPSTAYTYRVKARNGSGDSAYSNPASAATPTLCGEGDPNVVCLNGGRFEASITWKTADGQEGVGHPVSLSGDAAYFWFFLPTNIELVAKVLDGCALSQNYWVFATGLTNVETHLTVKDRTTGQVRTYANPQGQPFQPLQDTAAFPACGSVVTPPENQLFAVEAIGGLAAPSCAPGGLELCPQAGRFRVEAFWKTPSGEAGQGHAVTLTADSGYFWFFNESNIELVVKVLDACAFANRYWVFAGGLTNVEVRLRVTDTANGTVKEYLNPLNQAYLPLQDANAFATCP